MNKSLFRGDRARCNHGGAGSVPDRVPGPDDHGFSKGQGLTHSRDVESIHHGQVVQKRPGFTIFWRDPARGFQGPVSQKSDDPVIGRAGP